MGTFLLGSEAEAQRGGGRGGGGGGPGNNWGGYRWGGGYGGGYYAPYYYSQPHNYYQPRNYYGRDNNQYRSFYPPANYQIQDQARLRILLPMEDAQVWLDGALMQQGGLMRVFETPPLEAGNYSYTVRARWRENGREQDETRTVHFHPGDSVTVDFRQPQEETLPRP